MYETLSQCSMLASGTHHSDPVKLFFYSSITSDAYFYVATFPIDEIKLFIHILKM
jgi:hypothetical protein